MTTDKQIQKLVMAELALLVVVEIDVALPTPSKNIDADIVRSANNVLGGLAYLPMGITVNAENGWVALSGSVEWAYQRQLAEGSIRYLTGVLGIRNNIKVKPTVS